MKGQAIGIEFNGQDIMTDTHLLFSQETRDTKPWIFEALDAKLTDAGDALAHKIVAVKAGKKQSAWEVDAISGATISSVAVAKALDRSMQRVAPLIQRYKQELSRVGQ